VREICSHGLKGGRDFDGCGGAAEEYGSPASEDDLSFLLREGPGELLERRLDDYRTLLREAPEVRFEHLDTIDYAVRHWLIRLIVSNASSEELEDTYSTLRRLVPVAREEDLADWKKRWNAFADLLETRVAIRANQRPAQALKLAHAEDILVLIEDEPGILQSEIAERLGLKRANLSRILRVLEANELVDRRIVGREKQVYSPFLHDDVPSKPADRRFPFEN
jgi:DNA-binding transcriptional ArsR family regulator